MYGFYGQERWPHYGGPTTEIIKASRVSFGSQTLGHVVIFWGGGRLISSRFVPSYSSSAWITCKLPFPLPCYRPLNSPLFNLCERGWFLLFYIVFELVAGGIWIPVKAVLVYCFHKLNKAQKEHQKIDFSSRVEEKGRMDSLQLTCDSCLSGL